jgi:hypothetical protein
VGCGAVRRIFALIIPVSKGKHKDVGSTLLAVSFLLVACLIYYSTLKMEAVKLIQNVRVLLRGYTASYSRRHYSDSLKFRDLGLPNH